MSEWIKVDHSKAQADAMEMAEYEGHGYILRYEDGTESEARFLHLVSSKKITHYLICERHPHAEMARRQFDTGQPVWIRYNGTAKDINQEFHDSACRLREAYPAGFKTDEPNWYIPFYDFSFKPFEGEI